MTAGHGLGSVTTLPDLIGFWQNQVVLHSIRQVIMSEITKVMLDETDLKMDGAGNPTAIQQRVMEKVTAWPLTLIRSWWWTYGKIPSRCCSYILFTSMWGQSYGNLWLCFPCQTLAHSSMSQSECLCQTLRVSIKVLRTHWYFAKTRNQLHGEHCFKRGLSKSRDGPAFLCFWGAHWHILMLK